MACFGESGSLASRLLARAVADKTRAAVLEPPISWKPAESVGKAALWRPLETGVVTESLQLCHAVFTIRPHSGTR